VVGTLKITYKTKLLPPQHKCENCFTRSPISNLEFVWSTSNMMRIDAITVEILYVDSQMDYSWATPNIVFVIL
jgi:hypothetical protein